MRFTEAELTAAVTAAARTVATSRRLGRRGGDPWERMTRIERYHLLEGVGSQVLPVLVALPDVDVTPGTRPTFSDAQVRAAVEECAGEGRGIRRRAALAARTVLVQQALAALPERQDPDALLDPPD